MELVNQNILVTSNEPWGDVWFSKHNWAYELSRKNKVFFLNPPVKWRPKNLVQNPIIEEKYTDNLSIINYQNYFPLVNDSVNKLNNKLVSQSLKNYFQRKGFKETILWAFDQQRLYNPQQIGAKYGVYHCADPCGFQFVGERILCDNSDLIICISQVFADFYKEIETPKIVVPHGISSDEFKIPSPPPPLDIDIEDYGLFVGTVDARVDFDLLEEALKRFPDETFLFVGPLKFKEVAAANRIVFAENLAADRIFIKKQYKNLVHIGARPYKQLKYYINRSKFCISFMAKEFHQNRIGHHKTLGYLAQGKPVFSPIFSDYLKISDLLYMDDTYEGLLKKLAEFLKKGENNELGPKRKEYVKGHSFESLIKEIELKIQQYSNYKISNKNG